MHVVDAVHQRSSIRDYLDTPIDDEVLRGLLTDASRAASGGNLQPWRVYVVNGESSPEPRREPLAPVNRPCQDR